MKPLSLAALLLLCGCTFVPIWRDQTLKVPVEQLPPEARYLANMQLQWNAMWCTEEGYYYVEGQGRLSADFDEARFNACMQNVGYVREGSQAYFLGARIY